MIPQVKDIKRYFSLNEIVVALLAIAISISAGVGVFHFLKKDVVVIDDKNKIVLSTMRKTVGEVLGQCGIYIEEHDYINVLHSTMLKNTSVNEIIIKRAVPASVFVDGQKMEVMTYHDTVGELLEGASIRLRENDRLEDMKMDDPVKSGMEVKIVRVDEEFVTEKLYIPYNVEKRENLHMLQGDEKIVKEGKSGIREVLYRVIYEDGKETARELVRNTLVNRPINQLVEVGTILTHTTARGDTVRYSDVMNMRVTAYTASYKDTGKHPDHPEFGITFTGIKARKGIIAVDPKVIPLGTKVYVEIEGNTPDYGFALAADTGGAIKGDIIDIYLDNQEDVDRWGCKRCKVYVLADQ